ncbi:MAG TPA: D-alanyl-D-alanine carboxypeptidase/D-alanyl-D-alanine-endopeptidase [Bryobacteraceae bacterium]|jgi:D-alanyl-D-alanine carboxypeptidase/D-alanyl-D-alanine-endopeptidase (penicillin-binding protein 4)
MKLLLVPALLTTVAAAHAADLTRTIDALVDLSPLSARSSIGIQVVDLKTGKPVYSRNETRFFLPASNMKLFTTGLALMKLGADYRFQTRVIEEASGDLTLVGSGDPSMSGRVYPYRHGEPNVAPLHAIEELADQVAASGLTRVRGNIVGDDRLYPWSPYPPSWTQDDTMGENGAPVSALTVTDNLITITFTPGANPGDLAKLSISPALEYFAIDNRILTVPGPGDAVIGLTRVPGGRQLLFQGTIPAGGANHHATVALDDPALYAACALYDALTRRGIAISGHPVARHRGSDEAYAPPDGTTLAVRYSPPASQLIQMADKVSENLHAELLLRETGRVEHRVGTRQAGLNSLETFFVQIGGMAADARIDDGSGLGRNTLVTPRLVTRLLTYMYDSNQRDTWVSMLPIGGVDGTLAGRLCCASETHAIHAKTGTLNRAIALSGYAESKLRGWLAFSILVNDFGASEGEIREWIDRIASALVE